jgi:hypothetical protein
MFANLLRLTREISGLTESQSEAIPQIPPWVDVSSTNLPRERGKR